MEQLYDQLISSLQLRSFESDLNSRDAASVFLTKLKVANGKNQNTDRLDNISNRGNKASNLSTRLARNWNQ